MVQTAAGILSTRRHLHKEGFQRSQSGWVLPRNMVLPGVSKWASERKPVVFMLKGSVIIFAIFSFMIKETFCTFLYKLEFLRKHTYIHRKSRSKYREKTQNQLPYFVTLYRNVKIEESGMPLAWALELHWGHHQMNEIKFCLF